MHTKAQDVIALSFFYSGYHAGFFLLLLEGERQHDAESVVAFLRFECAA